MRPFGDQLREIESGEEWLRSFPEPEASAESVSRIRQAIRRELESSRSARTWAWSRWQGAMAAAAMLVLTAGVVMQMAGRERAAMERVRPFEQFVNAFTSVQEADSSLDTLRSDVEALAFAENAVVDADLESLSDSLDALATDSKTGL